VVTQKDQNADYLRRGGLSTVLALVNDTDQISRAEITAATGLNRSTIARIVSRLVELELVIESEPESTNRVGRPSPVVRVHPAPAVIAVNPEVDAITLGLVGLSATMIHSTRVELDHVPTARETAQIIADTIKSWPAQISEGRRILGIGVSVPGLVLADRRVRWAPHLLWTDEPLTDFVTEATGLPAWVGNDASLGALAEWRHGAARAVQNMVYLNGGASGIGGGVIAEGRPLGGRRGYAGEFGQNRPTAQGGIRLEDDVNRGTLLRALGLRAADELTLETRALASTDPAVVEELRRQRIVLSGSLANAVNVLNPSTIVLGGFLGTLHASDPAGLEALVAAECDPVIWEDTTIVRAALGADVLLIGAAELAFRSLMADSSELWNDEVH
jgi:predicted NBD/HSP70 family sugar kinase